LCNSTYTTFLVTKAKNKRFLHLSQKKNETKQSKAKQNQKKAIKYIILHDKICYTA
jgi:hypothetical protein